MLSREENKHEWQTLEQDIKTVLPSILARMEMLEKHQEELYDELDKYEHALKEAADIAADILVELDNMNDVGATDKDYATEFLGKWKYHAGITYNRKE